MITLYTLSSSTSSRKARAFLTKVNRPFVIRNMSTQPVTFNELKSILAHSTNGTEDIISTKGKFLQEIKDEGVDFDEISLRELHYYFTKFPRLMKSPIAVGDGHFIVGYDEDSYKALQPRERRMEYFLTQLEEVRKEENQRIHDKQPIALGRA